VQVGPFAKESRVFVKIGETRERNYQSGFMYDCMRQLKMPNVKTYVVAVIWDETQWKKHSEANVTPKTNTWSNSMLVKMRAKALKYVKMNLHMSMQVCELFKGIRIGWVKELHPKIIIEILQNPIKRNTFGKTLFEMIFFAVYAGVIDSGPFNSMLNSDGQVLLVDINIGDESAMLVYNTKGLYRASKKFDEKHISAVISYVNTHFAEAADFLARLKESACKNPYLLLDSMCPFFNDDNVELLRSGQKTSPYFKFLTASLLFNPCGKGASPPSFEATRAVFTIPMLLLCSGTSRDNIDYPGPPLTSKVPVVPRKVMCIVHLKAKTHDRITLRNQGGKELGDHTKHFLAFSAI